MTIIDTDKWQLSLDEGDPLHDEMATYLRAIRKRGRYSPVRRVLTRWAANGYLVEMGKIASAGGVNPGQVFDLLARAGLLADHASDELVAEALAELGAAPPTRPASSARMNLDSVRQEIAAIQSAADGMDFE